MKETKINFSAIDLIVYDFDGVMTDNRVLVFEHGKEAVFCNRSDGLAVSKIKEFGIRQIIISTEQSRIVKARAKKLGIFCLDNIDNKEKALKSFCRKNNMDLKKVLYVGNEINDLEAMKHVGFPVCPKDACKEIKKISKIILSVAGGDGVIRDLLNRFKIVKEEGC